MCGSPIDMITENGYLILRKAIAHDDQLAFFSVLRGMIEAKAATRPVPPHDSSASIHDYFKDRLPVVDAADHAIIKMAYETCFDTGACRRLFWSDSIVATVSDILGCDPDALYLYSNRIRIDPPGPQPFRLGWHQESSYGPSENPAIQIWGPLLWPSNWVNGSIEIGLGTHRLGHIKAVDKGQAEGGAMEFLVPEEVTEKMDVRLIEVEPCDVIVFSTNLIHRSSDPSRQKQMKYSITGRYLNVLSPLFRPYHHLPR
jgi:hypothetical protein